MMAANLSTLIRVLNKYNYIDHQTVRNQSGNSRVPITRDLLGGGSSSSSELDDFRELELDLDLHVPSGWEKRLDLKSGKVYIEKCNSSSSEHKPQSNRTIPKFQDLNIPPSSSSTKPLLNLLDETNLDLKLVSSPQPQSNYHSVCTLDKVISALERAGRESSSSSSKKRSSWSKSPSPTHSSSSIKLSTQEEEDEEEDDKLSSKPYGFLFAAGCPSCLLFVMISKIKPVCPRCNSIVPLPMTKKPKIDLNISM